MTSEKWGELILEKWLGSVNQKVFSQRAMPAAGYFPTGHYANVEASYAQRLVEKCGLHTYVNPSYVG
ncbi:hypothetical protein FD724_14620 [Nostoc sp. C057]|uniref:hypothetical protein n=1 Tax=Nostoc sp. C057 TaxID=2576903 RepID=UPI0015C37EC3|nr:hypothetical protein [Nostoc sp. C057]QLE49205.1 hypothetical protein FD724_14620 [Nostoc sp. C057]